MVQTLQFHSILLGLTTIIRIQSLPAAYAPFQHCPDRIIVNLVEIVLRILTWVLGQAL